MAIYINSRQNRFQINNRTRDWDIMHSICQQIWKTQQWPQDWKRSVFIPIPKKGNAKECSTTTQLYSFHTLAEYRSKLSNWGFNSMWTENFQTFKLVLEKAVEAEIKLPTSAGSSKKQESSRKPSTSAIDCAKLHGNIGEIVETVSEFNFEGLQIHCRWWLQPWN